MKRTEEQFREITLRDKALFDRYYTQCGYINSDCNFTNMYLWQQESDIRFAEVEGCLVLTAREPDGTLYHTMPIGGDVKRAVLRMREMFGDCVSIKPMTEEMRERLESLFPGQYQYEHLRDLDDYVYLREKLKTLSGKKMHAKRNHVNRFKTAYNYSYQPITAENLQAAAAFVYERIEAHSENAAGEKRAAQRLFENYAVLGVKGAVLLVDEQVVAVTVGENQNGTVLVHVEKADTAYHGAYAAINQMFMEREWEGYTYVNREEDMGIEGIRKAKLSYYPDVMVEKYAAQLCAGA